MLRMAQIEYIKDLYENEEVSLRETSRRTGHSFETVHSQWNTVFGDNRLTAALVDRLIHHSYIVIFSGESYRLTQSMNRPRAAKGV